jgi:uncharacterized damage-inducible protein DinB
MSTTIKDLALADFDREMATTRRFLERVPSDKLSWQPHERSMTLGRLAMHVAEIPKQILTVVNQDEYEFGAPGGPPPSRKEATSSTDAVEALDANVAAAREALRGVDDATLEKPWTFKAFGKVQYTWPKIETLRTRVMSHMIHHRAQLGVYLRLLGVANPPTPYGPSADERPQ